MPTTTAELVADAKSQIENLDVEQTTREIADGALLVDIREAAERATTGAIAGAVHVPRGLLEFKADVSLPTHLRDLSLTGALSSTARREVAPRSRSQP